eukprot:1196190-Prorocentrum_minimum.AAC.8
MPSAAENHEWYLQHNAGEVASADLRDGGAGETLKGVLCVQSVAHARRLAPRPPRALPRLRLLRQKEETTKHA